MKDKIFKVIKSRKSIRTMAAALALVTTLTSCSLFGNNNDIPEEPTVSYEQNIDDEHNHDHENNNVVIPPNVIIGDDNNNSHTDTEVGDKDDEQDKDKDNETVTNPILDRNGNEITVDENGRYVVNGLVIPDLSKSSYKGVSIVDALYLEGYDYNFAYLKELATYFDIQNYRGTAEQNTLLLKYLRTWAVDLGLSTGKTEQTNPGQTNPGQTNPGQTDPGKTETEQPGVTEEHKHQYGQWMSYNDELEYRGCSCGDIDYREHSYTVWVDLHNGTEARQCTSCGHMMVRDIVEEHTHQFGEWSSYSDTLEARECAECNELEFRTHKFTDWTEWTIDGDIEYRTHSCLNCGHEVKETRAYEPGETHTHSYNWVVTKQPTCQEAGEESYKCSECGKVLSTRPLPTIGHKLGAWVVVKQPTYTEEGLKEATCSVCGEVVQQSIPKKQRPGHEHSYVSKVTTPATCTEAGVRTYSCTGCDSTYTEAIPALGHNLVGKVTKEPTCTENGEKTFSCSRCDYTETVTIPAIGHDWDEGVVTKPATETETGIMTYTCKNCGETREEVIPVIGHEHKWGDWEVTTPATCDTPGVETRTCKCGETQTRPIPALGHEWGEWTVTTPATCDTPGVETRVCENGHSETRTIDALGHAWDEGVVTKAPTETEDGIMTYTCTRPGCNHTKTEVIPAIGHEHQWGEWKVTTPATCENPGVETRTCQSGHTETREIPALGHKWGEWTVTTAPTCDTPGVETRVCENGHSETRPIAALGHDLSTVTVDPTCTVPGSTTTTCSRCNYKDETAIPALGHDLGEYVQTKASTCSEQGEEKATCQREGCGHFVTRFLDKLAHTLGIVSHKDATCTQDGSTLSKCESCGHEETETIPAIGHAYKVVDTDEYDDYLEGVHVTIYTYQCDNCGHSYESDPIEEPITITPTGHVVRLEVEDTASVVQEENGAVEETITETEEVKDEVTEETRTETEEEVKAEVEEETQTETEEEVKTDSDEELSELQEAYDEYVELVTELQEQDTHENSYSEGEMSLTLTPEA